MSDDRGHFRLFGIPIRVRATFFFVVFMLNLGGLSAANILGTARWVAIVFVSILAHELGHAFMGRAFGLMPSIELYGFGGLTSWIGGRNVSHGRSVLISLAGPAVSFLLSAAAFVGMAFRPNDPLLADVAVANGFWTVFNLLPVMPLDGGNALRSLLAALGLRSAELVTRVLSLVIAVGGAIGLGLGMQMTWPALFLGSFAISNGQMIFRLLANQSDDKLLTELQAAYPAWLERRDGKAMIDGALKVRARAQTEYLKAYAAEVIAMGQCLEGDPRSALATLESMPRGMIPGLPVYLHVLWEAGETARANALAAQVMESDDEDLKRQVRPLLEARGLA